MYRRIEIGDAEAYRKREASKRIFICGKMSAMTIASRSMVESGLPDLKNYRSTVRCKPKYFFTEYGWKKTGHKILSEIRSEGVIAKVIALKENNPRLNILGQDKWQILATIRKCQK